MSLLTVFRSLVDVADRVLGKFLMRLLGALMTLGGLGAIVTSLLALRHAFAWSLLFPLGAGIAFLMLGVWLWRSKKRLSDVDWGGV